MSRIESFISAFSADAASGDVLHRIEIPLIQRDYAQGRRGVKVDEIRETFLDVIYEALAGPNPAPVSLDFVYGEITDGTLQPLDGQQRLTTLFLLHWYIAARAGILEPTAPWTHFSYATRQSARRFCERLVAATPPFDVPRMSDWITDQSWYLFVWRHDPTIQAMLVMLDAIHSQFGDVDAALAWERLADTERPAVSFHLLPLPDMGSAEDLYIKMNSRGKPLTDFENFKAHLEKTIESSDRAPEFARKVDVDWSDLLWRVRGDDDAVDDEFLRYLEFVTEICEWNDPELSSEPRIPMVKRTERVFGESNPVRTEHLDFLFLAFDAWVGRDIAATFEGLFKNSAERSDGEGRLPLFFRDTDVNLFDSCCRSYGARGGANRQFTFGQTLVLYAVLLNISYETEDFPNRVRVLRNLIEGSSFEMRADRMPRLVSDTKTLIMDGVIPEAGNGFSLPQIDDENAKRAFLFANPATKPAIDRLEDHGLLRGSLNAFKLDATKLENRATAFRALIDDEQWASATGALLATGSYQRGRGRDPSSTRSFQFAPPDKQYRDAWRLLLTGASREDLEATADVLVDFLDAVTDTRTPLTETFERMQGDWLNERELTRQLDWRYYMVKYRSMREGGSGLYFAEGGKLGYSLCNLRGGMTQMNSLYRDPYLLTIWRELGEPEGIEDPWFIGYEWNPRWLRLEKSGIGIRCVDGGFVVSDPTNEDAQVAFEQMLADFEISDDRLLAVRQISIDETAIDAENRIQLATNFVRQLLDRGL